MVKIKDDIFWTGYIDWDLRNFHGYSTPSGSSYNAYLIRDKKPVLIDTVKDYGFDEMLRRIKQVIDPFRKFSILSLIIPKWIIPAQSINYWIFALRLR